MQNYDFIVIGASQAGLTGARTLREIKPDSSILVINGEDRLPYKRTHLTKKLASGFETDDFVMFNEKWYRDNRINREDSMAVSLELEDKTVQLANGRKWTWGKLLLATGAIPKIPDIPGKEQILHLRRADETEQIRKKLLNAENVTVIGQGVEGVELAEQCIKMGLKCDSP